MFYQSFLNLPSISGDRRPDVLFVHASGKHRMAKLADTLRSLDVPVSVIADIDILCPPEKLNGSRCSTACPGGKLSWSVVPGSGCSMEIPPPPQAASERAKQRWITVLICFMVDKLRIPVKVISDSGLNVISESGQSGHRSERSDAGVGL